LRFPPYIYWLLVERGLRPGSTPFYKPLIGIFYGIGQEPWLTFNDALWFLTCLFVVEIAFYLLVSKLKRLRYLPPVLLACSAAGYFIGAYLYVALPWGIDIAFTAIVFYGLGYLLHRCGPAIRCGQACTFCCCRCSTSIFCAAGSTAVST
jgi:fucose 4-O-acetylase-like acetyltransferase